MNITLYTDYREAETAADRFAGDTGITHLVIERFNDGGGVIDIEMSCLLPPEMQRPSLFCVLSEAEWSAVSNDWDAEVQYVAAAVETT